MGWAAVGFSLRGKILGDTGGRLGWSAGREISGEGRTKTGGEDTGVVGRMGFDRIKKRNRRGEWVRWSGDVCWDSGGLKVGMDRTWGASSAVLAVCGGVRQRSGGVVGPKISVQWVGVQAKGMEKWDGTGIGGVGRGRCVGF